MYQPFINKAINYLLQAHHTITQTAYNTLVSCPAGKIGGKICLVTLRTILDTRSNFHTFRQEFERANRNAAFFNHCNSETGSVRYTCIHLLLSPLVASIMPINALITFHGSAY